jgi:hypothetical protein
MQNPYFFGYGSLVNRRTHSYEIAHPAHVSGWRRVWHHTRLRPLAFLSVQPQTSGEIAGLIAEVPQADWTALDEREFCYDRLDATHQVRHGLNGPRNIHIYSVALEKHPQEAQKHPILLSYLDVVLQGYLTEFGEEGAQAFLDTTDGWDTPILDDRAEPLYPRHQVLSTDETGFVDDALKRLKAEVMKPG